VPQFVPAQAAHVLVPKPKPPPFVELPAGSSWIPTIWRQASTAVAIISATNPSTPNLRDIRESRTYRVDAEGKRGQLALT
jgi:hypothetical protein